MDCSYDEWAREERWRCRDFDGDKATCTQLTPLYLQKTFCRDIRSYEVNSQQGLQRSDSRPTNGMTGSTEENWETLIFFPIWLVLVPSEPLGAIIHPRFSFPAQAVIQKTENKRKEIRNKGRKTVWSVMKIEQRFSVCMCPGAVLVIDTFQLGPN